MNISMPEKFYDWLDECPVQWFRNSDDGNGESEYSFVSTEQEEQEGE